MAGHEAEKENLKLIGKNASHHWRRGDTHQFQALDQRPANHGGRRQQKAFASLVRLGKDVVLVIEVVELLS